MANNTYTIPLLIQSDNCNIARTDFKVTGATNRSGSGTNASGIFNLGVSTVAWTVKDVAGNVSNCSMLVTVLPATHPNCLQLTLVEPGDNPVNPVESAVSSKASSKFTTEVTVPGLSIVAWPNPAQNYFNLKVSSLSKETVEIRMFSMAGILVQSKRGTAGETYLLGDKVLPGMYTIEVRQAGKTVRAKVAKQ